MTSEPAETLAHYKQHPGRIALTPELSPQQELALLCQALFLEGYDDHIAGHISYRQPDETLLINPWELTWDELKSSDIIRIDTAGNVIEGEWNVTPANLLHRAIHAVRADANVIIHNHPRYASVWANKHEIPQIFDQTGANMNGEIKLYNEYEGALHQQEQCEIAARELGDAKWALLANHGVLVIGSDIRQAHIRAVTLEWRCRQAWMVEAIGGGTPMPEEQAEKLGGLIDEFGLPFMWEAMVRRVMRHRPQVLK
ncbi:MAG: class II aldolase/adducin family protein [Halioglobus sp.]|nr:class II aldolase/adducin family protein [Halioglobus sp.]